MEVSLRIAVEEKARAFGCADAISNLAIIDAVRFLQHKERCTPCFGWEAPLASLPEGIEVPPGVPREKLCGVLECYWKSPCDIHRIMPTASLEECMDEELVRDLEGAMTPEASPTSDTVRTSWQKRAEEAGAAQQRHHDEAGTAAVLSRLADSATALVSVIQELAQQGASWRKSAGEQLDGLTGRYDELAEVVFGQQLINAVAQERYEEVCSAIATSREAHARHESDVVSLREGARERMDWFAGRVDEMAGQLGQHREHVSELEARVNGLEHLHSTVGDLSSRVQSWCERLDKQGEVLHALCEAHNQRSVVLDQFLEVLTRLRSGSVTAPEKL